MKDQCHICHDLWFHFKQNHEKETYECSMCDNIYNNYYNLKYHVKQKHNSDLKRTTQKYECFICNREYTNKNYLNYHYKIKHSRKNNYGCPVCPRTYPDKLTLDIHYINQHKIEKYKCNMCNIIFQNINELNLHSKEKHNQPAKYECSICYQIFKSKFTLRVHFEEKHKFLMMISDEKFKKKHFSKNNLY